MTARIGQNAGSNRPNSGRIALKSAPMRRVAEGRADSERERADLLEQAMVTERSRADRAEQGRDGERVRADALRDRVEGLQHDLDAARQQAQQVQQAVDELRRAWRGEIANAGR
jgi:hypothetical protein